MGKVTYWMRKLGMLRTSSYSVKGGADKMNEITASDGGMIQSEKDIDEAEKKKQEDKNNPA